MNISSSDRRMENLQETFLNKNNDKKSITDKTDDNDDDCENLSFLETILRISENDNSLRINHVKYSSGSRKGDNYMSVIKRAAIQGKFSNDSDYSRNLIIKRQITDTYCRQLFRCDAAFHNEISAYRYLIPIFQRFTNNRLPYPSCLFAGCKDNDEIIILDDLKCYGYEMRDRLHGLDYDHCSIVMQELGNIHAVSLAMKCLSPGLFYKVRNRIKEIVYCAEAAEFYTQSLECSLKETLSSLHQTNTDGELSEPIKCIEKLTGNLYKIMSHHVKDENNDLWKVICHGDIWVNNLMFRNDRKGQVEQVKLVDLQAMRYASPVIDILHFMYTSTGKDLRSQHFDQLIQDYQRSLIASLRYYVQNNDKTNAHCKDLEAEFTIENIKKQLRANMLYGLGNSMWLMPAVTFHPDRIPDLSSVKLTDFSTSKQQKKIAQILTPEYHQRMRDIVLEFYEKGILNRL